MSQGHGAMERYVLAALTEHGECGTAKLATLHPEAGKQPWRSLRSSLGRALRKLEAEKQIKRTTHKTGSKGWSEHGRLSYSLAGTWGNRRSTAYHEASHAVIGHAVGIEIKSATIKPGKSYAGLVTHKDKVDRKVAAAKRFIKCFQRRKHILASYDDMTRYVYHEGATQVTVQEYGRTKYKWTGKPVPAAEVKRYNQAHDIVDAADEAIPKSEHKAHMLMSFAGPLADCELTGWTFQYSMQMAKSDNQSINYHLKILFGDDWQGHKAEYEAKALRLVRKHWPTIERVAKALIERETLKAAELKKLMV